jgi:hypothetical protein
MQKKTPNTNALIHFEMKKRKTFYRLLIVLMGIGSIQAQNTKSEFHNTVDNINLILKANPLAYYTDTDKNSAFIKKISANEQGIVSFKDSIPKTENTAKKSRQGELLPDCCPPKRIRTLNLFAVKKWEIFFPMAYLKDEKNETCGRIIGIRKDDLFTLKEQFDKLATLCEKGKTETKF